MLLRCRSQDYAGLLHRSRGQRSNSSPQAKGRVERSHGVDQDRLIKELRLRGISTIAAANEFLESYYTPLCNRRFAVRPASSVDAHRRLRGFDLAAILSHQHERQVANDSTVQYEGCKWQIKQQAVSGGLRRGRVIVERRLDGSIKLRWQGKYLKCQLLAPPPLPESVLPPPAPPTSRRADLAAYKRRPLPAAGGLDRQRVSVAALP